MSTFTDDRNESFAASVQPGGAQPRTRAEDGDIEIVWQWFRLWQADGAGVFFPQLRNRIGYGFEIVQEPYRIDAEILANRSRLEGPVIVGDLYFVLYNRACNGEPGLPRRRPGTSAG